MVAHLQFANSNVIEPESYWKCVFLLQMRSIMFGERKTVKHGGVMVWTCSAPSGLEWK